MRLVRYILIAWSVFGLGFTVWAMATQQPQGMEILAACFVAAAFALNLVYLLLNQQSPGRR